MDSGRPDALLNNRDDFGRVAGPTDPVPVLCKVGVWSEGAFGLNLYSVPEPNSPAVRALAAK